MTEQTALATGLTTAITARDFTPAQDQRHVEWNSGALRHVITALAGKPVMIITDALTGSAMLGAVLVRVQHSVRSQYDDVVIDYRGNRTLFKIFKLGETIVPLVDETGTPSAKWNALATYRVEKAKAIEKACAEHGVSEGREWGKWDAKLFTDTAQVTYKPSTGNPAFADKAGERGLWEYRITDLND